MPTIAAKTDVQVSLLRALTPVEDEYADRLLRRVEVMLLVQIPDLNDQVEKDDTLRELVTAIEAEAVARVYRNPTALKQEADGSYSYSINTLVASGLLDVLASDWARLGYGNTGISSSAGAIDGYAKARYNGRPDLWFQSGWPGGRTFL
ncbi:Gp19/Gp15/Gp42 family protein [Cnuibacter sp. UC19_7]|uniref:Gp19/Gp15/Gp42 family protein n=1 Tax=Cnuibacter sp. UC19_7 TaxID=3350166 RepID=UPI003671A0D2